jgi:transposase
MMVKLLLYAYATGVFSSRKIARKLHQDVAFRMIGAGNFPKHRTVCDFRAVHLDELAALFMQVVKMARECGLVKLGTIAVDGTKWQRANLQGTLVGGIDETGIPQPAWPHKAVRRHQGRR